MSLHIVVIVFALGTGSGGTGTPPTMPPILVNSSWTSTPGAALSRRAIHSLDPSWATTPLAHPGARVSVRDTAHHHVLSAVPAMPLVALGQSHANVPPVGRIAQGTTGAPTIRGSDRGPSTFHSQPPRSPIHADTEVGHSGPANAAPLLGAAIGGATGHSKLSRGYANKVAAALGYKGGRDRGAAEDLKREYLGDDAKLGSYNIHKDDNGRLFVARTGTPQSLPDDDRTYIHKSPGVIATTYNFRDDSAPMPERFGAAASSEVEGKPGGGIGFLPSGMGGGGGGRPPLREAE